MHCVMVLEVRNLTQGCDQDLSTAASFLTASVSLPFPASRDLHISWLMAPSSVFKASKLYLSVPFLHSHFAL